MNTTRGESALVPAAIASLLLVVLCPVMTRAQTGPCVADTKTSNPTPEVIWDIGEAVNGFRLYWRDVGTWQWNQPCELPCHDWWDDSPEVGGLLVMRFCYGIVLGHDPIVPTREFRMPYPIQRCVKQDRCNHTVEIMVKAYNDFGESEGQSNIIEICMPELWFPEMKAGSELQ